MAKKGKITTKQLRNMLDYYTSRDRFSTVRMADMKALGDCRAGFKRAGTRVTGGRGWFYVVEGGRMTYYYTGAPQA